MNNVIMITA